MALPKLLQKLFTNGGSGDKLNKSIVPDLDYLPKSGGTVNGSVTINGTTVPVSGSTETYKEGIKFGWGSEISQSQPNGLDIWAKRGDATTIMALYGEKRDGDTTGNTPGMFFRAGDGTNTRHMKLSATKGLTADVCELLRSAGQKELVIAGADNDGCVHLIPGNDGTFSSKKSASLYLTSTGYTGNTIGVGQFVLSAMDTTTGNKSLIGSPDGSLTWCGKNVLTGNSAGLTVVAESYGASSWYRKYSDGWIEQGGYLSSTKKTVSFLTAFNGVPLVIGVVDCVTATSTRTGMIQICSVTTSSFYMRGWATGGGKVSEDPGWWYACGK